MSERVCVIGAGLIGGSLLKALRTAGGYELIAVDSDDATRRVIEATLRIPTGDTLDAVNDATVIVLALPVPTLLEMLAPLGRALAGRSGVVVTDVAGIKLPVLQEAARSLPPGTFVGGHPMAGKERGGYQRAEATLFQGCTVALCATPGGEEAANRVEVLWQSAGARIVRCDAEAHDRAVARVSHLPYMVAASLARVAGRGDALSKSLAAGGLRDTTRVAEDATIRGAATRNAFLPALVRETAEELVALAEALERDRAVDAALDDAAIARKALFP